MTKPAAKITRTCAVCSVEFGDTTYGKYCPAHRAEKRKSALEKHHYLTSVYRPTPEIDEAIRRVFVEGEGSLLKLAKRFRWSINAMSRRAASLGYARPRRGEVWSAAELEFLERNAHLSTVTLYKRMKTAGFKRSEVSIRTKVARLGLPRGEDATASSVALGFGVGYTTVVSWINRGQLKARRRGGDLDRYGRDWWIITHDNLRDFVLENPLAFDIRKVDQLWFIELVSGGLMEKPAKPDHVARPVNDDADDMDTVYQIAV